MSLAVPISKFKSLLRFGIPLGPETRLSDSTSGGVRSLEAQFWDILTEMLLEKRTDPSSIEEALSTNGSAFPMNAIRNQSLGYYQSLARSDFENLSIAYFLDGVPICVAIRIMSEGVLSFFDEPYRVEFSDTFLAREDVSKILPKVAESLLSSISPWDLMRVEIPVARETTNFLLEKLLPRTASHSLFVEVSVPLSRHDATERSLRKSHRQSIQRARKLLSEPFVHFGEIDREVFHEFKSLHTLVSGRQTRGDESWEEQYRALELKKAMLVTVRLGDALVGGTFSWVSPSTAYYVSGAYDRNLFQSIPISHLTLQTSIEYVKELGCSRYIVGDAFYIGGGKKLRSLGQFKRGFSKSRDLFHSLEIA